MGAARSALQRTVRSPVQTQRQVEKVLDGPPTLAPKHETTKDLLNTAKEENQSKFELHNKKSEEYLRLLKEIRVNSVDPQNKNNSKFDKKSTSSSSIEIGKLTSEQFTMLFRQRLTNPDKWNEEKIAAHFKLPSNSVENLLKYYSDFNVQMAPKIPEPLAD